MMRAEAQHIVGGADSRLYIGSSPKGRPAGNSDP